MAQIKQSNYILEKNLVIRLFKSVKTKAYLPIFNENFN